MAPHPCVRYSIGMGLQAELHGTGLALILPRETLGTSLTSPLPWRLRVAPHPGYLPSLPALPGLSAPPGGSCQLRPSSRTCAATERARSFPEPGGSADEVSFCAHHPGRAQSSGSAGSPFKDPGCLSFSQLTPGAVPVPSSPNSSQILHLQSISSPLCGTLTPCSSPGISL